MSAAASTGSPAERRSSTSRSFSQDENIKHQDDVVAQAKVSVFFLPICPVRQRPSMARRSQLVFAENLFLRSLK